MFRILPLSLLALFIATPALAQEGTSPPVVDPSPDEGAPAMPTEEPAATTEEPAAVPATPSAPPADEERSAVAVPPTPPPPVNVPDVESTPQAKSWLSRPLFRPYEWLRLKGVAEIGSLAVLFHTIQFGSDGTQLDYLQDGGQDNLFPFARMSAEAELFRHHTIIMLYQPLDLRTTALLSRDIVIDDLTFPAGTPMQYRYGFDFVRGSYLFDFFGNPDVELAIGASFQLRNATIDFASQDGALFRSERNIGPVPILKARGRYTFDGGFFTGFEADGFWASGRWITGSANDFEGAIYDVSLRAGVPLTGFANTFVNLRFLGGGARGVEEGDPGPGDGFTDNWLHTVALSLGFELF